MVMLGSVWGGGYDSSDADAPRRPCSRSSRSACPRLSTPDAHAASPVGVRDIVAGSVGRSSLKLDATYDARLRLSWANHRIKVDASLTIRNTSGARIDRVELNTIAARLGAIDLDPVTVDGVAVKADRDDQTIVVPLGGVLPSGGTTVVRVRVRGDAADLAVRLQLAVHEGERHRRPVPLAAVGQPHDAVRPPEPRRPVRHAVSRGTSASRS